MRTITLTLVIAVLTAALGGTVWAGTINGTARSDVLRGGTRADKLFGRAGNDKLYGLAGNDVLNGGTGNDLLVGGPGADTLVCGPGHDQAMADARDRVAKDCEVVKGLPKPPAISIADASIAEGNSGTTTLTMAATLSAPSAKIVSVHFATVDGTATAATGDYVTASGTLTFNPGQTAAKVDVTVNGDTVIEPDETLTVNLSSPVNATIADGSASGTIKNEDTQVPAPAGSYKGQLPSGDFLFFEITQARQVSYFRLNDLRENCSPGGFFEGSVAYPQDSLWPIADDGTAAKTDVWSGTQDVGGGFVYTHYEYRTTVKFDGSATVTGTIQLKDEFDYAGSHFSCDTGVVSWTATKIG